MYCYDYNHNKSLYTKVKLTLRRIQNLDNQKMIRFITILFLWGLSVPALSGDVQSLRIGQHPDKTRLVIELTGEVDFQAKITPISNSNQSQLEIHIPKKQWAMSNDIVFAHPFTSIDQRHPYNGITSLYLPISSPHRIQNAFMLAGTPHRLVIDLVPTNMIDMQRHMDIVHGPLLLPNHRGLDDLIAGLSGGGQFDPTPIPIQKPSKKAKPIIVIDAGHGGKDPGAISKITGIQEKQITLPMAKMMVNILNQSGRYDARLTRSTDIFIKLHNRVKIAQRAKADLFISVHADSVRNNVTKGASVYTLSDKASDKQSARLAARENQADLIDGLDLNIEDEDVSAILIDLSMRESVNQSKIVANNVIQSLRSSGVNTLKGPHRYAGFAVLKAPDIPSILIETGFVSNATEARKLLKPAHQRKIARAILKAVDDYYGD